MKNDVVVSKGNFGSFSLIKNKKWLSQKKTNGDIYYYVSTGVYNFIDKYITNPICTVKILNTLKLSDLEKSKNSSVKSLINIRLVNDIRYINKYFEKVNNILPYNGVFVGCAETMNQRKHRIFNKYPRFIRLPFYYADFILKRIFPKFQITLKLYFLITHGKNRVLSLSEILGRLISCGFQIIDYANIENHLWFAVKKTREPYYDNQPSYRTLFKMKRIGKDGKTIYVYKIRTMHPYSEYLQAYLYEKNGTLTGDKITNDFRIANWGRIFRKYWIDELPMLVNWLIGDLKLVGVRPLSVHKFSIYPDYLVKKRIKYKPGLFPPCYADLPETQEEFFDSEEKYLDAYEKNPFKTDLKYLLKILYNILIKHVHSA